MIFPPHRGTTLCPSQTEDWEPGEQGEAGSETDPTAGQALRKRVLLNTIYVRHFHSAPDSDHPLVTLEESPVHLRSLWHPPPEGQLQGGRRTHTWPPRPCPCTRHLHPGPGTLASPECKILAGVLHGSVHFWRDRVTRCSGVLPVPESTYWHRQHILPWTDDPHAGLIVKR